MVFLKNIPGGSFSQYLSQEQNKWDQEHKGIFQDVEEQENVDQAPTPLKVVQRHFTLLPQSYKPPAPKAPATKAAPAPGKRKIVLEDD